MKISFMKSHQRLLQYTDASNLFDSLGAWIHIVLNCIIYAALISQIWLLSMQPRISKLTIQFVFWTTHNFHFIHRKIRTIYQKSLWNTENGLKTSFWTWSRLHVLFHPMHRLPNQIFTDYNRINETTFYRNRHVMTKGCSCSPL